MLSLPHDLFLGTEFELPHVFYEDHLMTLPGLPGLKVRGREASIF